MNWILPTSEDEEQVTHLSSKMSVFSALHSYFQGLIRQEQTDYLFAHTKVYVG